MTVDVSLRSDTNFRFGMFDSLKAEENDFARQSHD